jgi:glycosyltransferase involved in cell wall biosynthesis
MRISLVTPSFNKAAYLEAALLSVLGQNFPDLDYAVVDGGSQDGTAEILARYKDRLSFAVSEPDKGMYDALAKGFARATGEIMGYLGADDLHLPWTLSAVAEIFAAFPEIDWITSAYPVTADASGRVVKARHLPAPTEASFFRGANLPGFSWYSLGWIQQESTFWRRSLWDRAGGFDPSLKLAGDFDLWCRFLKFSEPAAIATPLAAFRRHGDQITGLQASAYGAEALSALMRHGGKPDGRLVSRLREVARRLGLEQRGRTITFDFKSGRWQIGRA